MKRILCMVMLSAPWLLCGCARDNRLNVLLVTLDTTRADHLGCYGYPEPSTPTIDDLASQGALFSQAFCTNPITLPSHASILTGTYPIFHGARDNSTFVVRDEVTTLAETLSAAGYETAAVIGSFVLDSRFNLDQGFAHYDDDLAEGWSKDEIDVRAANAFGFAERKANLVSSASIDWLRQPRSRPFFMWIHYFDPHEPINPPEPHHSRFTEPYTAEIAFADEQLGQVIAELKAQGEFENTLIVVTGDHGEGLLDHGEPTHSLLIYDSVMHVPLIFVMPGEPPGRRLDQLASTVDIMPTVLELLGQPIPDDVQGKSLAAGVRGSNSHGPPREIYMESMVPSLQCRWGALRGLRTATEKLIHGPKPRYYHVDEDPGEIYDRAAQNPEAVKRLTAKLCAAIDRWKASAADASISSPDEEALRKLSSLGYISNESRPRAISNSLDDVLGKDDPHEMRWLFDLIGLAMENVRGGHQLIGIRQFQQVLEADPDNLSALTHLGKAYYLEAKQPLLAKEQFERALEIQPDHETARYYMCRIMRTMGDIEGSRMHAEKILETQPTAVAALYELAGIYEMLDDPIRARKHLKVLLDTDPSSVGALLALALSHARRGEHEDAGPYLKQALDFEPESPQILYNVGIWHLAGGDTTEALASLQRAVDIEPRHGEAQYVLGKLLLGRGEPDLAREALLKAQPLVRSADRRRRIDNLLQQIDAL